MRIGRIVLLACLMASFTHRAMAVPIAFDFSFLDVITGNNVAGVITGLNDDSTGAASSVFVTSNSGGYGGGEYVGAPIINDWTVVGGVIVKVEFVSFGLFNGPPAVMCCTLGISDVLSRGVVLGALSFNRSFAAVSRQSVVEFRVTPTGIPIPSALALLGLGLLGLGVSRRKRKLQK